MRLTKDEKAIPGKRRRLFLELYHKCNDNKRFCRICRSNHTKDEQCRMLYKKIESKSQKSKLCYVSHAIIPNDFPVECYECYSNGYVCKLHKILQPVSPDDTLLDMFYRTPDSRENVFNVLTPFQLEFKNKWYSKTLKMAASKVADLAKWRLVFSSLFL